MIRDVDDLNDPACLDCALDRCHRCMLDDPAPLGKRECCCGSVSDVTVMSATAAGGRP